MSDETTAAAPVRVLLSGEPFAGAARRIAAELAADTVASRLAEGDPSVWPHLRPSPDRPAPGWPGLPRASRPLAGQVAAVRERLAVDGAHRVLLVGTPDAVTAARLLAAVSAGPGRLTALDSADPVQIAEALSGELAETALVVVDPTGDDPVVTAVTHAVRSVLADEVGPSAVAARTVHVTEPGSPLDTPGAGASAGTAGVTVVTLDHTVPGRFGTLGPLGLVPAGLAGADVAGLLGDAVAVAGPLSTDDPDNPVLLLAGALVAARGSVLALRDADRAPGLTGWLAPLLAAAGLVAVPAGHDDPADPATPLGGPVDGPGAAALGEPPAVVEVHAAGTGPAPGYGGGAVRASGPTGATVVLWQRAVALAARVLETDPFAPAPPVADPSSTEDEPTFVDGGVAVYAGDWLPDGVTSVAGALDVLAGAAGPGGHLAVSAWLDPESDASVAVLGGPLAGRTGVPVAFGWAPGCRGGDTGGPDRAAHCHLTGGGQPDGAGPDGDGPDGDRTVGVGTGDDGPGTSGADGAPEPSGLDSLHEAQARAVIDDQRRRGRPVLRLHLTDRVAGLVTLARAVQG